MGKSRFKGHSTGASERWEKPRSGYGGRLTDGRIGESGLGERKGASDNRQTPIDGSLRAGGSGLWQLAGSFMVTGSKTWEIAVGLGLIGKGGQGQVHI
jgi:hypothetical protein